MSSSSHLAPAQDPGWATPAAAGELGRAIERSVGSVVLDAAPAIRLAVASLLVGGHVLVEGTPGVGKTLLGKALARTIGGTFARVQGTSDLLPSDITGVSVYDLGRQSWEFRPGPLFGNVVLFDELNRATPRAQSALLEGMAEQHVTVDGVEFPLPSPQFVVATQNPQGDAGTFAIPGGARDRFTAVLLLGNPSREAERQVVLGRGGEVELERLDPLVGTSALLEARRGVDAVRVVDALADYVVDIADATRHHPLVALPASTRASKSLLRLSRAVAVLDGRDYATVDDVKSVAPAALAHRLVLRDGGGTIEAADLVSGLLASLPVRGH